MRVLVVDAQGGGMGRQLVAAVRENFDSAVITAVGTNSAATAAMRKAGADYAATGENAVIVGCRDTDVILGPIGIVIADALLGEITPSMAAAIGQSRAVRLLLPLSSCGNVVLGARDCGMGKLLQELMLELRARFPDA